MSTNAALTTSKEMEPSLSAIAPKLAYRAVQFCGIAVGLVVLIPLFPLIGFMHLLAFLEKQEKN